MRKPIVTALSAMLSAAIALSLTATASYAQNGITTDTASNTVQTQKHPHSLKQPLNPKQAQQKHRHRHQRSRKPTRNLRRKHKYNRKQNQKRNRSHKLKQHSNRKHNQSPNQNQKHSRTPLPHCKPKARITPSARP